MSNQNKSNIMVSVTLLAYHHVKYIRKCLDSILEQKVNFRYEIIVGEDGSNDGSKEILEEYKEKYPDIFVLLINKENKGACINALNVLRACRGKYISCGEADDFWTDEYRLQKEVDVLERNPHLAAVGCNYFQTDEDGNNPVVQMKEKQVNRSYCLKDYLKVGYTIHGNTLMFRNGILPAEDTSFQKLMLAEPTMGDIIYRVLIYDAGDIFVLPDVMHAHRSGLANPTSYSSKSLTRAFEYSYMHRRIVNNISNYFSGKYNLSPMLANRASATMIFFFSKENEKKDYRELIKYLFSLSLYVRIQTYIKFMKNLLVILKNKVKRRYGI